MTIGAGPDGAEAHDADLARSDQRRGVPPAEGAVVGDRERPAPEFGDVEPAVAGGGREAPDLGPEIGQAAPVRLADDRHDQALRRGHRQPDVAVRMDDDHSTGRAGGCGGCGCAGVGRGWRRQERVRGRR